MLAKSYWNPLGQEILYFHVTGEKVNFYLKVDVVCQKVFKAQLETDNVYKYFKRGIYELKWNTFYTGYSWDLRPENISLIKKYEEKDGVIRDKIKHTTKKQWQNAVNEIVKQII